jgi:hypothetical protein
VSRLTISLVTAGALALIASLFFTLHYGTNDDIAMRLLAEGRLAPNSQPTAYLLFINIILGRPLAWAYAIAPGIPWYDLLMNSAILISAAVLLFLWGGANPLRVIWSVCLGIFFLLPIFVSQQFTQAAMLCATAGVGLWARAARESLPKHVRRLHLWLGLILFVWGGLIRAEGAALVALVAAAFTLPLAAIFRGADKSLRSRLVFPGLTGVAAAILLGLCFVFNLMTYARASGWRDFHEFNLLRAELTEYLPAPLSSYKVSLLQQEVGWSPNDISMLQLWFFTDPNLFNLSKLREAAKIVYPGGSGFVARPTIGVTQTIKRVRKFLVENYLAFLILAAFTLAYRGYGWKLCLFTAWMSGAVILTVVVINLTLKQPPYHVYWSVFILQTTFFSITLGRLSHTSSRLLGLGMLFCAAALVTVSFNSQLKESRLLRQEMAATSQELTELNAKNLELGVLHANNFPYQLVWSPFRRGQVGFPFLPLGASAQTPPIQEFLRSTGRLNLPLSICSEPRTVLVTSTSFLPLIAKFIGQHDGREVEFELAQTGTFRAWQCHSRPDLTDTPEH